MSQVFVTENTPLLTFGSFGESSLNLVLRFHVGTVEQRLPALTALNCAIAREFAAAGIEIPFPQRDIHLRTLPEKAETLTEHGTRGCAGNPGEEGD